MQNELDYDLLVKYFAGECSAEEQRQIEVWITADPLRADQVATLRRVWEASGDDDLQGELATAWMKIARRIDRSAQEEPATRKYSFRRILQIAAAVVVLIGGSYGVVKYVNSVETVKQQLTMREISTPKGQRIKLLLTDGTIVSLNSASSLRFPERFKNGVREVFVQGEAFFDVAHVEGSSFVVRTANASVKVLGTAFNVTSWPGEKRADVIVVRGRVAVRSDFAATNAEVELVRGQKTSVLDASAPNIPQNVNVAKYTAWIDGKLVFDNLRFTEVIKRLERQYDIECKVRNAQILDRHVTASFKDESLNEILHYMSLSLAIKYEKKGSIVTFYTPSAKKKQAY